MITRQWRSEGCKRARGAAWLSDYTETQGCLGKD